MNVAIIPVKDEPVEIVRKVICQTKKYVDKIIVVDSSKKRLKLQSKKVVVIREKQKGKGIAIRRGINELKRLSKIKNVIFIDSDGERDPNMIPKILKKLKKCEVVICIRKRWRNFRRKVFNFFSRFWINLATGYKLRDPNSGYFGIRYSSLKRMKLKAKHFEIEMDVVLNSFALGYEIGEVIENNYFFTPSKFKVIDIIRLNYFFDNWCIKNRKRIKRKVILLPFVLFGYIISSCFLKFF